MLLLYSLGYYFMPMQIEKYSQKWKVEAKVLN